MNVNTEISQTLGDEYSNLLSTLALVQTNWSVGQASQLDQFVPFVLEVMNAKPDNLWTEHELAGELKSHFGVTLEVNVVGNIVRRAKRLQRVEKRDQKYLLLPSSRASSNTFAKTRTQYLRRQRTLVAQLVTFSERRFNEAWSPSDAEKALLAFLARHSSRVLAALAGSAEYIIEDEVESEKQEFIVSSFVYEMLENDHILSEYLDEMVKGLMLASAIYRNSPALDKKFRSTTIFFDAPVLLGALGYEGSEAEVASKQLFEMAISLGARLACFSHTRREIESILHAVSSNLRGGKAVDGSFPVLEYYRARSASPADVLDDIGELEERLAEVKINVEDAPEITTVLSIDEDSLTQKLHAEMDYRNPVAALRDVDSLTAIYRLRNGSRVFELETCKALFVSDNRKLAKVGWDVFHKEDRELPLVVDSLDLAGLLWVKQPQRYPEAPRTQVIADCISVISPTPDFWQAVIARCAHLQNTGKVSEAALARIRWNSEFDRTIVNRTYGDPKNLTDTAVLSVLEVVDSTPRESRLLLANEATQVELEVMENKANAVEKRVSETKKQDDTLELANAEIKRLQDINKRRAQKEQDGIVALHNRIKTQAHKASNTLLGFGIALSIYLYFFGIYIQIATHGTFSNVLGMIYGSGALAVSGLVLRFIPTKFRKWYEAHLIKRELPRYVISTEPIDYRTRRQS